MEIRGHQTKTATATVNYIAATIRVTTIPKTQSTANAHQMKSAVPIRPGKKIRSGVHATRKKNVALPTVTRGPYMNYVRATERHSAADTRVTTF